MYADYLDDEVLSLYNLYRLYDEECIRLMKSRLMGRTLFFYINGVVYENIQYYMYLVDISPDERRENVFLQVCIEHIRSRMRYMYTIKMPIKAVYENDAWTAARVYFYYTKSCSCDCIVPLFFIDRYYMEQARRIFGELIDELKEFTQENLVYTINSEMVMTFIQRFSQFNVLLNSRLASILLHSYRHSVRSYVNVGIKNTGVM